MAGKDLYKKAIEILKNHGGKMKRQNLHDALLFDQGFSVNDSCSNAEYTLIILGKVFIEEYHCDEIRLTPEGKEFYREIKCATEFLEKVGGVTARNVLEK